MTAKRKFKWRHGDVTVSKPETTQFTAETPVVSTVHHPIGKKSLWNLPGNQELPAYIQNVAHAFLRKGATESDAISKAVGVVKDWAEGRTPNGKGKVTPQVQAAAAKAIAEWEAIRAKTHAHSNDTEGIELSNSQHDGEGKFAPRAAERERLLKIYQRQQGIPETGKVDDRTRDLLKANTQSAADRVTEAQSATLSEDVRNFFKRSING